ncbi:type II toxin-antitoxin system RelE/ParE family toxin [Sulfoacidibacillus ferrooxidans]
MEWLDSLHDKHTAKVLRSMDLLEEFGPGIGMPHVENITENIRCLRTKQGSNIFRVLFFTLVDQRLILLSGFTKKTPKTPPAEIERAIGYRNDFLEQQKRKKKGSDGNE